MKTELETARLVIECESAISSLRMLRDDFSDYKRTGNLYLSDIINEHP